MISTQNYKPWQQYLLITMMLINVAIMLGFFGRIQYNQQQQKITVGAVLNDYAAMAAQQFARNIKGQIGYAALYDLGQAWSGSDDPLTTIIEFLNAKPEQLTPSRLRIRDALTSIQILHHESQSLQAVFHPQLTTPVNQTIPEIDLNDGPGIQAIHDLNSNSLSFRSLLKINANYSVITRYSAGFVTNSLQFLLDNKPVLPTVLTDNKDNQGLNFELKNSNNTLWSSGSVQAGENNFTITIDKEYGALFADYQLSAYIDRNLASQLIIGGLPGSQNHQLFWLIGLAILTLFIMFWLNKRTRLLTQQKEQFIARASHELKTPLTQIRLFAETMALKRIEGDDQKEQYINIILKESIRLNQLVDNILNQHQVEQGHISRQPEPIQPHSFIEDLIQQQQILWQHKSIQTDIDINTDLTITTDPNLLKQILINVLDNAIKFGPTVQTINISGNTTNQVFSLEILDQGPGIPEHQIAQVMQPYQRLPRDENRGVNGNGLGLAITYNLVQQLGGQFHIKSTDHGTRVIISLPLNCEMAD